MGTNAGKGKRRYVLVWGLVQGLSTALILFLLRDLVWHDHDLALSFFLSLMWVIAGCLWALRAWNQNEQAYRSTGQRGRLDEGCQEEPKR